MILRTKPIRVSFNMLCCAVLMAPWGVLPRETLSGFFGRHAGHGSRVAAVVAAFIDSLHTQEPNHCHETFLCEQRMRTALYS